jgi:hypothetical protein
MRRSVEPSQDLLKKSVDNARKQIMLLVEEYTRLCKVLQTDSVRQRMNDINNDMIPHLAILDAANEQLVK